MRHLDNPGTLFNGWLRCEEADVSVWYDVANRIKTQEISDLEYKEKYSRVVGKGRVGTGKKKGEGVGKRKVLVFLKKLVMFSNN